MERLGRGPCQSCKWLCIKLICVGWSDTGYGSGCSWRLRRRLCVKEFWELKYKNRARQQKDQNRKNGQEFDGQKSRVDSLRVCRGPALDSERSRLGVSCPNAGTCTGTTIANAQGTGFSTWKTPGANKQKPGRAVRSSGGRGSLSPACD